jgi:hypothetical protein
VVVTLTDRGSALRSVNDDIAAVAAQFAHGEPHSLCWGFACECGRRGCSDWVKLELASYEALRADPNGAVLAEGHTPATRAQIERDLAADLREQARALRGQARQQTARARRVRVTRDYCYELRDGETAILTGHLGRMEPLELGDLVDLGGLTATVVAIEPIVGDQELRLVVELRT